MMKKPHIAHLCLGAVLLLLVAAAPVYAGSGVIGLVKGTNHASVGGQTLLPDTTLFSGDHLEVNDGLVVLALGGTSRMTFGPDTAASFLRDSDGVTVLLSQGGLRLFHGESSVRVRVKVGDLSVVPVPGFNTRGEVAAGNGAVAVTVEDGKLLVGSNGQAIIVAKGETLRLPAGAGASQAAGETGVPKLPVLSLPSLPQPSPLSRQEAGQSAGSVNGFASGLSRQNSVQADAKKAALNAPVPAPNRPVIMPATDAGFGDALHSLAYRQCPPSPYWPFRWCWPVVR